MPDNHDIFDWHEHHGAHHHCTHEHDDHPRHHHDANGSIHYLNGLVASRNVVHTHAHDLTPADLIGASGFDITHRTPRTP